LPNYRAEVDPCRRTIGSQCLTLLLATDHPDRAAAAAHPDVRRIADLVRQERKDWPDYVQPEDWAVLAAVAPTEAADLAAKLTTPSPARHRRALEKILHPTGIQSAIDDYLISQAAGKKAEAAKAIEIVKREGIPFPEFKR